MKLDEFLETMRSLLAEAEPLGHGPGDRVLVMSDLHLGDRSTRDDFRRNEDLVTGALGGRYLPGGWRLVLNGDVEELHKFDLKAIRSAYAGFYGILAGFRDRGGLRKLVGNHDHALLALEDGSFPVSHSLRIEAPSGTLLAFHGHQSNKLYAKYNQVSQFIVRRLASPLRIPNFGTRMTSRRRYRAERRIYRASKELGVAVIAGHTHRPLFESHSKYDALRWNLESLLRAYTAAPEAERGPIAALVEIYKEEFRRLSARDLRRSVSRSLYEKEDLLLPCMFNSGSATGREGFTAIEVEGPDIALVYWNREGAARPYIEREALESERLEGTPWRRYVIARDSLEYIFARLRLLA